MESLCILTCAVLKYTLAKYIRHDLNSTPILFMQYITDPTTLHPSSSFLQVDLQFPSPTSHLR